MNTLAAIQPLHLLIQVSFLLTGSLLLWIGGRFLAKLPQATFLRSLLAYLLIVVCYWAVLVGGCTIAVSITDGNFGIIPLAKIISILLGLLLSWCIIKLLFKASWPRAILAWLPTLIISVVSLLLPNIAKPSPQPIPLELSHETTRILGPLNPDGTVNYLAALNAKYSEGVTPENNAAVLLLQALGPNMLDEDVRDRTLAQLDMPELPTDADYLIFFEEYKEAHEVRESDESLPDKHELSFLGPMGTIPPPPDDGAMPPPLPGTPAYMWSTEKPDTEKAAEAPWSPEDYPFVADWLDANEASLDLIVAASQRPRYYMPMLSPEDPPQVISVVVPGIHMVRSAAEALLARAMLKANSYQIDAACADILAVHRLARLMAQGPTIMDRLVS